MGGTRQLGPLSNNSHPKLDTENENMSLQNDSSSPRVAGVIPALWLYMLSNPLDYSLTEDMTNL